MEKSRVWFKNDLRIEDNKILSEACKSSDLVIGVYFLDPEAFKVGAFGFKKNRKIPCQIPFGKFAGTPG